MSEIRQKAQKQHSADAGGRRGAPLTGPRASPPSPTPTDGHWHVPWPTGRLSQKKIIQRSHDSMMMIDSDAWHFKDVERRPRQLPLPVALALRSGRRIRVGIILLNLTWPGATPRVRISEFILVATPSGCRSDGATCQGPPQLPLRLQPQAQLATCTSSARSLSY